MGGIREQVREDRKKNRPPTAWQIRQEQARRRKEAAKKAKRK